MDILCDVRKYLDFLFRKYGYLYTLAILIGLITGLYYSYLTLRD